MNVSTPGDFLQSVDQTLVYTFDHIFAATYDGHEYFVDYSLGNLKINWVYCYDTLHICPISILYINFTHLYFTHNQFQSYSKKRHSTSKKIIKKRHHLMINVSIISCTYFIRIWEILCAIWYICMYYIWFRQLKLESNLMGQILWPKSL